AYKFLTTSGSMSDDESTLHSSLAINAWDLDYGSREYGLWPHCDMRWRAGIRVASLFFDSVETSPALEQRVANYFSGVGPHVGLDLRRFIMGTGFELIGRLETAFLIGEAHQSFGEAAIIPGVGTLGAASRFTQQLVVPWLNIQA